eukprot:5433145-Amphidinium_carterae.1
MPPASRGEKWSERGSCCILPKDPTTAINNTHSESQERLAFIVLSWLGYMWLCLQLQWGSRISQGVRGQLLPTCHDGKQHEESESAPCREQVSLQDAL